MQRICAAHNAISATRGLCPRGYVRGKVISSSGNDLPDRDG